MKFVILLTIILGFSIAAASASDAYGVILVKIPGIPGDSKIKGFENQIIVESFSLAVQRELAESGGKGGTQDINIGVGELQEILMEKSLDVASSKLFINSISGNALGNTLISFIQTSGIDREPVTYLEYCLTRTFVKDWSTSASEDDRPNEDFSLLYNQIASRYTSTTDGKAFTTHPIVGWDKVEQRVHDTWDCT